MANRYHQFRRCHVCGGVSVSQERVEECGNCGKPIAPFYYFDDRISPVLSEGGRRPPFDQKRMNPLLGLTAYWEEKSRQAAPGK